jgi:hypothetical protein
VKQCLSILIAFCISTAFSFAQDKQVSPSPTAAIETPAAPQAAAGAQDKSRIFVTDEPLHEGNLVARGNAAAAHTESGANPRVVEIQADLVKVCPRATVTNRPETADFTLLFRREGGKRSGFFAFGGLAGLALSAASRVDGASLFDANGDLVTATKQRTVENAIREICASIPATITHMAPQPAPDQPAPAQAIGVQIAISSVPDAADIEVDGAFAGNTPSAIELTPGEHIVVVHKKGFNNWERKIKVSAGSISLRAELDPAT